MIRGDIMEWLAGTSGYSYPSWRGNFYPETLEPEDWLAAYSRQLPAIEIAETFDHLPRTQVIEQWAAAVPVDFRFAVQAPRQITHQLKLENVEEQLDQLIRTVASFEDKLGAVLFELPLHLRKSTERLEQFLVQWPHDLPVAVAFHHQSWFVDEIMDLLNYYDVALCVSDEAAFPTSQATATTDWCYLRLRHANYGSEDLARWIQAIGQLELNTCLAFFNPEDAEPVPANAQNLLRLVAKPEPIRASSFHPGGSKQTG